MKPIKVGIIDSGLDRENKQLMKYVKKGVNLSNGKLNLKDYSDNIGHGTAVADLIAREFTPNDIEFYIYKIFDEDDNIDIKKFKEALEYILEDEIDVINCSLGTIDPAAQYELKEIVENIVGKGIVMFCAWNDEDYTTWPANFERVISVKSGNQKNQNEWDWEKNKHSHFIFRGTKQRVRWKNNRQLFIGGSSFAAALCTRHISNAIVKNKLSLNFPAIEKYLQDNAIDKTEINLERSPLIHWNDFHTKMKKVGLYPFYKEMHGFVRFRKELNYEISWIADFSKSRNTMKSTKDILEKCNEDIYIQTGLPKDHNNIDTLIIGYLDKASDALQKNLLNDSLTYALKRKINVFSFLPPNNYEEWKNLFISNDLWLEVPFINNNYALNVLKKVPEKKAFDTPILGVFGTSSQQGKFTLQLALRYEMQKRGYRVAQIGTEHQSGCFGMDFTFPNGYGMERSLQVPMDFHIPFLRRVISEMDKEGTYDIIIVGAQSGVLCPDYYYYTNIYTQLFLVAALPDRIILIYNNEDKKLIKRINGFIYAITGQNIFEKICFENLKSGKFYFNSLIENIISDSK